MKLKEKINKIYPNQYDFILEQVEALKQKYQPKSTPKKLSHKDAILICYADSFKKDNEPSFQTLKNFMDKHLNGYINAVHILPFFPFTSDDGFSVVDYYKVNAEYGNWQDVENLGKNYDLMFDAVVNHMSKSSDWFQGFLNQEEQYNDFFIVTEEQEALKKVVRPRALPLLTPFQQNGEEIKVWTTFSEDQIDLNYASPKVYLQVLDILLFYALKGARYIRLDAIAFIWKTIGTSCIHLEETHLIIQSYREIISQIFPSVVLITETNVPHQENISYFGNGFNEAHMVYNFTLPPLLVYSIHNQNVEVFVEWAKSLSLPSNEVCFFNFTASHDGVGVRPVQGIISVEEIEKICETAKQNGGFVSYKTNEDGSQSPYEINCNYSDLLTNPQELEEIRIKRFLLTQAVMLTFPGVPGIYYHSIVGSENDKNGVAVSGIKRRINREKLEYETLDKELETENHIRFKIHQEYKKLLKVRKENICFNPFGSATYELLNSSVFSIERQEQNQKLIAVFNFSNESYNFDFKEKGICLLSKSELENNIKIPAFDFKWILIESK